MRAAVVIPSAAFASSAGARIRYRRLAAAAAPHELAMVPIDALDTGFDAYVFAKTYQAAAPVIAHGLAARGKPVVLDVFDDYFTDRTDARLARFRLWLGEMARTVHAVTVSTPALAERLARTAPAPPVVIPDPAPAVDPHALAARLRHKQSRADPGGLGFVWFGIASNPYFRAGLEDLGAVAARLGGPGTHHTLTVLTNAAGAREEALAALSGAPLSVQWREWSNAAEADALASADVAVLPVNDGAFATAKSLNRAVTALSAGAQVLSLGAPIYAPLHPFIYRDRAELESDAAAGILRLRPDRVPELVAALADLSSPQAAAGRLFDLLAGTVAEPRRAAAALVVNAQEPALLGGSDDLVVAPADGGIAADIAVGGSIALSERACAALAPDLAARTVDGRLDPVPLALPVPPPLSGHGVIDTMRSRARLAACEAAAATLLPDRERIIVHDRMLPP